MAPKEEQGYVNVLQFVDAVHKATALMKSKEACFSKALQCEADGGSTEAVDKWLNEAIGYEKQLVAL
jgi:hypothetical protein|tara:strand:- start:453 stop:653 length:201 start_codon:yes stop_codon:yes gene_type:complete